MRVSTIVTFLFLDGFKEKAKGIFEIVKGYISLVINYIQGFFSNDANVILCGAIMVLAVILIIAGLIAMLKKTPKFFVFIIFLIGIVVGLWYFVSC